METVWNVPVGTLKYTATTQVIRESACIDDTTSCFLTITDTGGDGLLSSHESTGFAGWYAFLYGSQTIVTYAHEPNPEFATVEYCVGPKCTRKPQSIAGTGQCETAYLALQLDNRPQDTTYQLVCNGETIWDGRDFVDPGAYIEEESCIPPTSCCTFTVTDADSLGMTSPYNSDMLGFVYLEWNFEGLLEYDGVTGEEFDVKSVEFGMGCDDAWQNDAAFPVDTESSNANYGGHGEVFGRPGIPDDFFGDVHAQKSGVSEGAKIALFTLAGVFIFCALSCCLYYRSSLLRQHPSPSSEATKKQSLGKEDEQTKADKDEPEGEEF
jgi:hypothetical protein